MLAVKRIGQGFEQAAQVNNPLTIPPDVLLYSPKLLQLTTLCIWVLHITFFIKNVGDMRTLPDATRLIGTQVVVAIAATLVLLGIGLYAHSHYKACVLAATLVSIGVGSVADVYLYGLDVYPHLVLVLWFLIFSGFTLGWRGLLLSSAWMFLVRLMLQVGDAWGWWPHRISLTIEDVKYQNLVTFISLFMMMVSTMLCYLLVVRQTQRGQQRFYRDLQVSLEDQHRLNAELLSAQTAERERIGREIHEGSLNDLSALRTWTWIMQRQAEARASTEALVVSLEEMRQLLANADASLRTVMSDLRPRLLDEHGLAGALEQLAHDLTERSNLAVLINSPQCVQLDWQTETTIFRIVQEALTNIYKHAQAQRAWVEVTQQPHGVYLEVRDDGRGFLLTTDLGNALNTGHIGLASMYSRVKAIGGQLQIESVPGQGTLLRATIPSRTTNGG